MGHSQPSLNPSGGDVLRRGATQPALHDDLMARVVDRANLQRAWKRVKANQGAPGIDGLAVEDFAAMVDAALEKHTHLLSPTLRLAAPRMIAVSPPLIGDAGFKIGVGEALGGANAWVAISTEPPIAGVVSTTQLEGPIVSRDRVVVPAQHDEGVALVEGRLCSVKASEDAGRLLELALPKQRYATPHRIGKVGGSSLVVAILEDTHEVDPR